MATITSQQAAAEGGHVEAMDVDGGSDQAPAQPDLPAIPPAPDPKEVRELVASLISMFPNTPSEFFKEQAQDLVGKPAAFDRLVDSRSSTSFSPIPAGWLG